MLEIFFHHKLVVILASAAPLTLKWPLLCSRKHTVTTVKFKAKWQLGKDLGVTLSSILKEASLYKGSVLMRHSGVKNLCPSCLHSMITVVPEIVSPLHALGCPMRNLFK